MSHTITSKEVMAQTGISRATLNNYISMGILPKPDVASGDAATDGAARIGFFPVTVLETIAMVDALKKQGYKMTQIAEFVASQQPNDLPPPQPPIAEAVAKSKYQSLRLDGQLRLTLDNFKHPAYMVNRQFELEWCNSPAAEQILFDGADSSMYIDERNFFRLFANDVMPHGIKGWEDILAFHVAIARNFVSNERITACAESNNSVFSNRLVQCFNEDTVADPNGGVLACQVNIARGNEPDRYCQIYALFFREGIFFSYVPDSEDQNSVLSLLARRDVVIRDLLKHRKPYLTDLTVLVADLQSSVKICAELPSDEYFELINEIWTAMDPLLRKYKATHGKHAGDGVLYYFLPQPDSDHVCNAIQCAMAMKEQMKTVCEHWMRKKNWLNKLKLNIGIDEGQEWFGSYQTPTHIEFTALGDTINNAGRLSDFARDGSIWLTKNVMNALKREDRERITFGIRRTEINGEEILVQNTFGRLRSLVQAAGLPDEKYQDVSALPVTEIFSMREIDQ